MQKILVATDFSSAGGRAVQVAARLARQARAALRVVQVAPSRRRLAQFWRVDVATAITAHRRAHAALRRVADSIDPSSRIEVSTGLVSGAASVQIARAARDYGADLLVIGAIGEHEERHGEFPRGHRHQADQHDAGAVAPRAHDRHGRGPGPGSGRPVACIEGRRVVGADARGR